MNEVNHEGELHEDRKASTAGTLCARIATSLRSRAEGADKASLKTGVATETITGVAEGWRVWKVKKGQLRSAFAPQVWEPDEALVATHGRRSFWWRLPFLIEALAVAFALQYTLVLVIMDFRSIAEAVFLAVFYCFGCSVAGVAWWYGSPFSRPPCDSPKLHAIWLMAHHCGIYACRQAEQFKYKYFLAKYSLTTTVLGRVALWGDVIELTGGFLGQYGYPLSFEFVQCALCGHGTELDGAQEYGGKPCCPKCYENPRPYLWKLRRRYLPDLADVKAVVGQFQ